MPKNKVLGSRSKYNSYIYFNLRMLYCISRTQYINDTHIFTGPKNVFFSLNEK